MDYPRNSILYVIMNIISMILLLIIEHIEFIPNKAFAQTISSDSTEEIFVDSRDSPEKLVTIRPYIKYTKEEMLSAIPYKWQSPQGEAPEGDVIPQTFSEYVIGEPGSIEGEPPEEQKILEAMPPEVSSNEFVDHNVELLTTGTGYPGPYTRYENFDAYTTYRDVPTGTLDFSF